VYMFVGFMFMTVFVAMLIVLMVVVRLFILVMGVGRTLVDGEFYALDVLPHLALPMGVEIADLQLAELPLEGGWLDPEVAQGAHGHVTADTGEAIEIENAHGIHWLHSNAPERKEGAGILKKRETACSRDRQSIWHLLRGQSEPYPSNTLLMVYRRWLESRFGTIIHDLVRFSTIWYDSGVDIDLIAGEA